MREVGGASRPIHLDGLISWLRRCGENAVRIGLSWRLAHARLGSSSGRGPWRRRSFGAQCEQQPTVLGLSDPPFS